jgi:hypothetical protein
MEIMVLERCMRHVQLKAHATYTTKGTVHAKERVEFRSRSVEIYIVPV